MILERKSQPFAGLQPARCPGQSSLEESNPFPISEIQRAPRQYNDHFKRHAILLLDTGIHFSRL